MSIAESNQGGTASAPALPGADSAACTPLLAVHTMSFLNSLGTGLVTNGIAFITSQGFGFSRNQNFWLALLLGITYIVGAAGASRATRALRTLGVSSRGVLALLMVLMAALCVMPLAIARIQARELPPVATIWILVIAYSPLSGMFWPLIESFLSGGRSGARLRSALGTWNVVWSTALVVAYWAMAPVVKPHPTLALAGLGGVHAIALLVLVFFRSEPGEHLDEVHGPVPPNYPRLLAVFRVLLPTCYMVCSALCPMMPETFARFPIDPAWQVRLAATWIVARVLTFLTLERWHRWHGSWTMPLAGGALLLLGFAGAALVSRFDTGNLGLVALVLSLFVFGVGMSTIYTGAIYYAMAVGHSEVDAGGTHEALIGVGYTVGPACGLVAGGLISAGVASERSFEPLLLAMIAVLAILVLSGGVWRASKRRAAA